MILKVKEKTIHEYHTSVNQVIDYINTNLNSNIDLGILSGIANISEFHFHRIFRAIIGEPVASYITRIRLENAAQKLQSTNQSLSKIADSTGYGNQQALSKAFQRHFGVSPSAFRNLQTYLYSQDRKDVISGITLNPKIKSLNQIRLIYLRIIAEYGKSRVYKDAWSELVNYAKNNNLLTTESEYIGLSFDDPDITHKHLCRFNACISTEIDFKATGKFGNMCLTGEKYAIFTLKGSYSGLYNLYKNIYMQWLPKSKLRLRNSMPFEKYLNNPDKVTENEILTEVYIPVKH
jgi:AraC family transcriptional regulator